MTARIVADDEAGRGLAIAALRAGAIVAMPTDTVYGIGVALETPGGIERMFHVKHRPPDKGIVLLLADADQADTIGLLTPAARALADACWPGGLTLVVAQRSGTRLPDALTGGASTIGLRVADHRAPQTLAGALGPLPVTSANVSGEPEATTAAEIQTRLGEGLDLILDGGPARGGPASTVVDCSEDALRILRLGAVPLERLIEVLGAAGIAHGLTAS